MSAERDARGRFVTRQQPYKIEPGEGLRPGIYEVQTLNENDGDRYPYVVGGLFALFCLLFAAALHWHWVPALCEWLRPK